MATGPGDGHKQYNKVLIDAPSMERILKAQKEIKFWYGINFFEGFATEWENPTLTRKNWQTLIDLGYPVERLKKYEQINDWSNCQSLEEVIQYDKSPFVSIEFVIDAFIWLLNQYGANIICLDEEENIPMICNWTCPGFKTVGYGCY